MERERKTERVEVNMEGVKENDKTDKDLKREGGGRWRETGGEKMSEGVEREKE